MAEFKPRAWVLNGCPFSFKFLLFMSESGLLDRIEVIRVSPDDPSIDEQKRKLSDALGKKVSFPTAEIAPEQYLADSDALIEHFGRQHNVTTTPTPVMSFYKESILPQVVKLHQMQHSTS